jgi:hypothetical protein
VMILDKAATMRTVCKHVHWIENKENQNAMVTNNSVRCKQCYTNLANDVENKAENVYTSLSEALPYINIFIT